MSTPLVLVSGKGGVGKSAVAAATALAARRGGGRVLAVDMTDAGGLGPHLGEPDLAFEPRMLADGLEALAIDRAEALVEYLEVQLGIPGFATIGPAARAFDALATTAPAVREVVTMGKVLWEVRRGEWDLVVCDAPPTGQVPSYLAAARTVRQLVHTGRIVEQVAWMEEILVAPTTELRLVTLLEELPVVETTEALTWVEAEQVVGAVTVVANRVLPHLEADPPPGDGPVAEAARLHRALESEQDVWARHLDIARTLPYLFGTHTPSEVAERLADRLADDGGLR